MSFTWLELFLALFAALASIEGLSLFVRRLWRQGPGQRRDAERAINRLAVGYTLEKFVALLGAPSARDDQTATWAHQIYYVLASVDDSSTVIAFSVTTRDEKFRPRIGIPVPPFVIRLLGTSFAELGEHPDYKMGTVGARRWGYYGNHYYGNPGFYHTYLAGINDAGPGDLRLASASDSGDGPTADKLRQVVQFNTFGIALDHITLSGVDHDVVRAFDELPYKGRRVRRSQSTTAKHHQ